MDSLRFSVMFMAELITSNFSRLTLELTCQKLLSTHEHCNCATLQMVLPVRCRNQLAFRVLLSNGGYSASSPKRICSAMAEAEIKRPMRA